MDPDKTYDFDKMKGELELLLASFDITRVKDSLTFLLLDYCKHLNDVPASFSSTIDDLDALFELLGIIQRYEIVE